jgi:quercetin dioxygenase-like cupin family protein
MRQCFTAIDPQSRHDGCVCDGTMCATPTTLLGLMSDRVLTLAPGQLRAGAPTPGVLREIAFEMGRATLMRARADPRAVSGWHHHGRHDVLGFVVRGAARFEFGSDGLDAVVVGEGGFFHVPAGVVHRDVNPLDVEQEIVLTLVGDGPLVVNVDPLP